MTFEATNDCAESFFPDSHLSRFIILCSLQPKSHIIYYLHKMYIKLCCNIATHDEIQKQILKNYKTLKYIKIIKYKQVSQLQYNIGSSEIWT